MEPTRTTVALGALLLVLTGCSRFNRDWTTATTSPSAPASGWDGEWRSAASGHHGRLRAIVTPVSPDRLRLRFRAAFGGILRSSHALDVSLQPGSPGTNTFAGRTKLGLWGTYHFEGTLSTNTLEVRYRVYYDHGMFQLHRIEPPPAPTVAP